MKFLADFFPVLLFFVVYQAYDIYVATGVAIAASALQTGYSWLRFRRVEKMPLITFGLLTIFGGLTLALRDPVFIKWKPTVVNWLFCIFFFGSQFIGNKNIVTRMMEHAVSLPDKIWTRINLAWVVFFFVAGLLNIYVAYSFSEQTWVNFKLFGMLGLTLIFVLLQAFYMARYVETPKATEE
jgi:intracellular septation protein